MKALTLSLAVLSFSVAQAQDGAQPDYSGSRDQLKPSQVNLQGETANPANASGVFLGAGISVGQATPTEAGSPNLASFAHFTPGYQVGKGSWGRIEFGADFFAGQLRLRHADNTSDTGGLVQVPIRYGLMPQFGYGYSLGDKMFGVLRVGVGLGQASLELGGLKDRALTGLAGMLGWDLIAPVSDSLDFTAGIAWTHWQFDVGELSGSKNGSQTVAYNRALRANANEIKLGLRMRL